MTASTAIYLLFALLSPCCALSFWSRDTWRFVRQELELGRFMLTLLLVMASIGKVFTFWLPRWDVILPERRTVMTCVRCNEPAVLGPHLECDHPDVQPNWSDGYAGQCSLCHEQVVRLAPPPLLSMEEAEAWLALPPVWRTASPATD